MKGLRLTEEEFRDLKAKREPVVTSMTPEKKKSKYGNKKKEINGILFDSTKEARRYVDLLAWQQSGQITKLETQKAFDIIVNGVFIGQYVADFTYWQGGKFIAEDVKSKATRKLLLYVWKKKLMKAVHGIEIQEL